MRKFIQNMLIGYAIADILSLFVHNFIVIFILAILIGLPLLNENRDHEAGV